MKIIKKIVCFALLFLFQNMLIAQESPYEIKVGNPIRKAVLDVIRIPTNAELGQKVEFKVSVLMAKGNWAFAYGQLQQVGGKALDKNKFADKDYKSNAQDGLFDDNFQAVLKKKNGKWTLVKRALGCTDVCWAGWWDEIKGVPREIFPQ
jgi:hypothetical protein